MMTAKKKIVFVDDDPFVLRPFIHELEMRGLQIHKFDNAADCISSLTTPPSSDLFIVDVMLPSGGIYEPSETHNDYYTGLKLVQDIRNRDNCTPIVILTQMHLETATAVIEATIKSIGNACLIRKTTLSDPREFAEYVSSILEAGQVPTRPTSLLKRLGDAIILQPNFGGFGIDLKKL